VTLIKAFVLIDYSSFPVLLQHPFTYLAVFIVTVTMNRNFLEGPVVR